MSIAQTTINRIKRVCSEITDNAVATSPGPWYLSHGHVISPGTPRKPLPNGSVPRGVEFDVAAAPSEKDHTVEGLNPGGSGSGRNDMRHIVTCEPRRMAKLCTDVAELLAERDDVRALAERLDDLINRQKAGGWGEAEIALGADVEKYLASLS